MSAFMCDKTHLDALVTAARHWSRPYGFRYLWPRVTVEQLAEVQRPGMPFTEESIELSRRYKHNYEYGDTEKWSRAVAVLAAENRRSVDYRYNEDELEEPMLFEPLPGEPKPEIVLMAIRCYEYQSCEHPEWEASEAYAFIQALQYHAIRVITQDVEGAWEIVDRDIFLRP